MWPFLAVAPARHQRWAAPPCLHWVRAVPLCGSLCGVARRCARCTAGLRNLYAGLQRPACPCHFSLVPPPMSLPTGSLQQMAAASWSPLPSSSSLTSPHPVRLTHARRLLCLGVFLKLRVACPAAAAAAAVADVAACPLGSTCELTRGSFLSLAGLDSAAAYYVMAAVRRLAEHCRTVVRCGEGVRWVTSGPALCLPWPGHLTTDPFLHPAAASSTSPAARCSPCLTSCACCRTGRAEGEGL